MVGTIGDFLTEVVQNSFEAHARHVHVLLKEDDDSFEARVEDDGEGMDEPVLERVTDPFYGGWKHPSRPVSLGLPLLAMSADALHLTSRPHEGTTVTFCFDFHKVDTPPVGDLARDLLVLLTDSRRLRLVFDYQIDTNRGKLAWHVDSDALGDLGTSGAQVALRWKLRSLTAEAGRYRSERKLDVQKESMVMTREALDKMREQGAREMAKRVTEGKDVQVVVGMGTVGIAAGAKKVVDDFLDALDARRIDSVLVTQTGAMKTGVAPVVEVLVPGMDPVVYEKVDTALVGRIIDEHIVGKKPVADHMVAPGAAN